MNLQQIETTGGDSRILRWGPYLEADGGDMEFRLTYEGEPFASNNNSERMANRARHVHDVRRRFHSQLRELWRSHPNLNQLSPAAIETMSGDGFVWQPLVTQHNNLICKLDILMLRPSRPGNVLTDIDNRLKTLFDALRRASDPIELGSKSRLGQAMPQKGEDPFYVLLQDDKLITHIAVTTDMLLDPVPGTPADNAVKLVIGVTVRPYKTTQDNLDFV